MLKGEKVKPEDAKTVSPELHDTITAAVAGAGMSMFNPHASCRYSLYVV